jgi:hypothetical protein
VTRLMTRYTAMTMTMTATGWPVCSEMVRLTLKMSA